MKTRLEGPAMIIWTLPYDFGLVNFSKKCIKTKQESIYHSIKTTRFAVNIINMNKQFFEQGIHIII